MKNFKNTQRLLSYLCSFQPYYFLLNSNWCDSPFKEGQFVMFTESKKISTLKKSHTVMSSFSLANRVDKKRRFQFFAKNDYCFLLDMIIAIISPFFAKVIIAIS